MEYPLILGAIALLVVGWLYFQYSQTQRDLALEAAARRLGMNFRFGLPAELKEVLPRFRVIEKARESGGEFQAGINSITGTRHERKVAFFDFQWVTVYYTSRRSLWTLEDGRPHHTTHTRSAVAAQIGVAVQPILIRPERLVDKAAALAGYPDINFASLPEFSSRFYVNSPDEASARRFVTPRIATFFLEHVDCTADIVGPWLILHRNSALRASRVPALLDVAAELADLITREHSRAR